MWSIHLHDTNNVVRVDVFLTKKILLNEIVFEVHNQPLENPFHPSSFTWINLVRCILVTKDWGKPEVRQYANRLKFILWGPIWNRLWILEWPIRNCQYILGGPIHKPIRNKMYIWIRKSGKTNFSLGWQNCSTDFFSCFALRKSLRAALPALQKFCPFLLLNTKKWLLS